MQGLLQLFTVVTIGAIVHTSCQVLLPNRSSITDLLTTSSELNGHRLAFTFRQPATRAFVEYRHTWASRDELLQPTISFSFRTARPSGLLLYYGMFRDNRRAIPQVWTRLRRGTLHVTLITDDVTEGQSATGPQSIIVGRELNNDQWNNVSITIDLIIGQVIVGLNTMKVDRRCPRLTALSTEQSTMSIISIGGLSPSSSVQLRAGHYMGCIGDVMLTSLGRRTDPFIPYRSAGVEEGCIDRCHVTGVHERDWSTASAECDRVQRCVNDYVTKSCNCFSMETDSSLCVEQDSAAITLQGSDWLLYNLYDTDETSHIHWTSTALQFKTRSSEGILFYGRQQFPAYSHVAISLYNTSLHVSVVFTHPAAFNELYVSIGQDLDDNRWHSVNVDLYSGQTVEILLDGVAEKMTAQHPNASLDLPPSIYFGGMDISASTFGLKTQRNFLGCLRDVHFNHVNVIDLINSTDLGKVKYRGDGPVMTGCHDLVFSAIQFTHSGSFARIEHGIEDYLDVGLTFRTLRSNCLLSYTETSAASERGFIQVELVKGQLEVSIRRSIYSTVGSTTMTLGARLNHNEWHTLRIVFRVGYVLIELDELRRAEAIDINLTLGDATYLGFGPVTDMTAAFVGCLKNIKIQDVSVDPIRVVHSQLGVGLSLGDCELVDWCQSRHDNESQVCYHGGRCVSQWRGPVCDCSTTRNYEGITCQTFVDTSTVTFENPSSFLTVRLDSQHNLLLSDLTFSFHVNKSGIDQLGDGRVLLKAVDFSDNSTVTVHLVQDTTVVVQTTQYERILRRYNISIPDEARCEFWTNVTISLSKDQIKINGWYTFDTGTISANNNGGTEQQMFPESQDTSSQNAVAPPYDSNRTEWLIYVGGEPSERGFMGCLTSVSIDEYQLELVKAATGLTGILPGCIETVRYSRLCVDNNNDDNNNNINNTWSTSATSQPLQQNITGFRLVQSFPTVTDNEDDDIGDADDNDNNNDDDDDDEDITINGSFLSQVVEDNLQEANRNHADQSRDYATNSWIGLFVLTALLVSSAILLITSYAWTRVHRHAGAGVVMTIGRSRDMSDLTSIGREDDEEEGLLNDVTHISLKSSNIKQQQQQRAPNMSRAGAMLLNDDKLELRGDIQLSHFFETPSIAPHATARLQCGWSDRPHTDSSVSTCWDCDELENSGNIAQMEWDPQSDVGSPMLPLHNLADDEFFNT